jgi:hypothetical protein
MTVESQSEIRTGSETRTLATTPWRLVVTESFTRPGTYWNYETMVKIQVEVFLGTDAV